MFKVKAKNNSQMERTSIFFTLSLLPRLLAQLPEKIETEVSAVYDLCLTNVWERKYHRQDSLTHWVNGAFSGKQKLLVVPTEATNLIFETWKAVIKGICLFFSSHLKHACITSFAKGRNKLNIPHANLKTCFLVGWVRRLARLPVCLLHGKGLLALQKKEPLSSGKKGPSLGAGKRAGGVLELILSMLPANGFLGALLKSGIQTALAEVIVYSHLPFENIEKERDENTCGCY